LRQTHEPGQGGALIHCNEEGELSLVVHVVPFGQHADLQPDKERPVAGLVIVDCQQGIIDRINAFADFFALTAGEARVVAQLVSGGGVTKAASRLNIAPSTVRSHLTHIMEKTGTHRQAELVKIVYEVTLPWCGRRCAEDKSRAAVARG
jgi:DNA-binding CsgD family transcriptional regulator